MSVQQPDQPFRLGNLAPNFTADTTQGRITLYDYLGDNWAVLFCYPDDFNPVATTELVLFTQLQNQFVQRGVKLLALSTHNEPVGEGGYVSHEEWIKDVNDIALNPIKFPLVSDKDGRISRLYHVLHDEDLHAHNADTDRTATLAFDSRTIFIIGPKKHFRLIFTYPAQIGINPAEVLRAVDALQTAEKAGVHIPANWAPGRDVIIPTSLSDKEAKKKFPGYTTLRPYLRFTPQSEEDTSLKHHKEVTDSHTESFLTVSA